MSRYRLIIPVASGGPVRPLSINLSHRGEALIVAQRYDGPAELWDGDDRLCSINRFCEGGMWVITD